MTSPCIIYSAHLPCDGVTEPSESGTLQFVDMINNSLTSHEFKEKNCVYCKENTIHAHANDLEQPRFDSILNHPPEIVVQIMRYDSSGRKLRKEVGLPSGFFAIRGHDVLYYMKYVAMHLGDDRLHGHYIAFERPSPAQAAQRAFHIDDLTGMQALLSDSESPSRAFNRWTRYEDDKKFENQDLSEIES